MQVTNYYVPTVIETTARGERQFDLYSRLLKDRIIIVNGAVEDGMANAITMQLLYLDGSKKEDITMYINSPGGVVTAGYAIFDTMRYVRSDIRTIALGQACSMGSFLLAAGTKGKRYALPSTRIMIHQPSGGVGRYQATDIQIQAAEILRMKEYLTKNMSEFTGKKYEQVLADMERDNFMSSQEAKDYGIIDEIVTNRESIKI